MILGTECPQVGRALARSRMISSVEAARVPEVTQLREAYRELCGSIDG